MIHIKLYFEYTLYVNYIKDVIIMKEERFTELDKDDIKRIITCRQYKWLDDMESEYSEYRFFLEKLKSIKDVKYIGTRDMVYVVSSDYKYKDIKFTMIVDLEYESVDFLVDDCKKVEDIRNLIEGIIKECM